MGCAGCKERGHNFDISNTSETALVIFFTSPTGGVTTNFTHNIEAASEHKYPTTQFGTIHRGYVGSLS